MTITDAPALDRRSSGRAGRSRDRGCPALPRHRGPLSEQLFAHWLDGLPLEPPRLDSVDPLTDDDLHLALWCCHELHYRGFDGLDDDLEWDGPTLAWRAELERAFEAALRVEVATANLPDHPATALRTIAEWAGPPLARTMAASGVRWQLEEFAVHRSAYQLKEADPHTWAIPRLHGAGRSALLEIQIDEYGGGRPGESHAELFAAGMAELGLNAEFGHYVGRLPGATLATDNLASMFGLNRRLRGALVGHLALFEMCSVVPMTHYLTAARRLGPLPALERFYEVHVEADVHHAQLAMDNMVGGLLATEPDLASELVFGAAALSRVEARFARRVLDAWTRGETSLLDG